jgi:hypothetical protein
MFRWKKHIQIQTIFAFIGSGSTSLQTAVAILHGITSLTGRRSRGPEASLSERRLAIADPTEGGDTLGPGAMERPAAQLDLRTAIARSAIWRCHQAQAEAAEVSKQNTRGQKSQLHQHTAGHHGH